jgi:putative PEP-CTERM system integral membrane protein
MRERLPKPLRTLTNPHGWAKGLFWSWNLIFLAFMLLGFAPQLLPEMMTAVNSGDLPTAFLIYAILLTAIPVVAVIIGFIWLRRSPGRLFALGYGVEGPLMLLLAIRFFAVRQLTPAVALLLVVATLGMATYLWQILDRNIDSRGPLLTYLRVAGLTLLLVTGLYISLWLGFYAVPLGVRGVAAIGEALGHLPEFFGDLWTALIEFNWRDLLEIQWGMVPFIVLGMALFGYSATLFVLMPVAVLILYTRAWWQGLTVLLTRYGRWPALGLTGAMLAAMVILFIQTNRQPQHRAFALLETPPANLTEAQALLDQEETIRTGLLNSYLAPQRYFSAVGEVSHVSEMYKWGLGLTSENAEQVQQLYETVARPVLYEPVNPPQEEPDFDDQALRAEPLEAADLYAGFFDRPILDGEREAIVQAARTTWSIDQATRAWQAVDDREIHLVRQELTISEQGDWAEIELYEVYQNQTAQRQEVIYYFSLPESAVITGVWLGNSPERAERFTYRVSPRGAAQSVYRNEVRRNLDPALVEQLGPRQYRLRVFPVEPQTWRREEASNRAIIEDGPPLHMWLTWRVLAQEQAWPLPHLAEKRNVYWDDTSVRLVNEQPLEAEGEAWLPASVPARMPVQPVTHRIDFHGDQTVLIQPATASEQPSLAGDLKLALVLDRSRSMAAYEAQVEAALARLADLEATGVSVEVYLTASEYRGEGPARVDLAAVDAGNIIYYGGQNPAELLAQFEQLRADDSYDAILVLTDGAGYRLGPGEVEISTPPAPVWMIHVDGNLPLGYDDPTLKVIQASGGGVAGNIEDALTRLALALKSNDTTASATIDLIDGYVWQTLPTQEVDLTDDTIVTHQPGDGFVAFAARRLILAEMHQQRVWLDQLDTLDQLHALALEHSIVTPYSSMIVLVTRQQEQLLDQIEAKDDRFQREFEDVGDTIPENAFAVTGVPEPEEWLLLALVIGMLGWMMYRKMGPAQAYGRSG